jgi:hypothetical protein
VWNKKWGRRRLKKLNLFRNCTISSCTFLWRVALFSKLRRTTHLQISHGAGRNVYALNGFKREVCLYCMRRRTLQQAPKQRLIPVASKSGNSFTKTQYHWHHSVDRMRFFCHVKFEARFVISLYIKPLSNKKRHFLWAMARIFFSRTIRTLWRGPFPAYLSFKR